MMVLEESCSSMRMSFGFLCGGYLLIHLFLPIGSYRCDGGHRDRSSANSSFYRSTYARAMRIGCIPRRYYR